MDLVLCTKKKMLVGVRCKAKKNGWLQKGEATCMQHATCSKWAPSFNFWRLSTFLATGFPLLMLTFLNCSCQTLNGHQD